MTAYAPPVPQIEMNRLFALADLDLDYSNLSEPFKDLVALAAKVAGTDISLINLLDSYTQWTVSSHNLALEQMAREESVCQYTILQPEYFEVQNLQEDERFSDKSYVNEGPRLRYYFGVPLKTDNGEHVGALCVMDRQQKSINPEKIEMLAIIAGEIMKRLQLQKTISSLRERVRKTTETKMSLAHDIRGPLGGIMSLAQIICEQGDENKLNDVLQFISMIQKSSQSLLGLADEILISDEKRLPSLHENQLNLMLFKEKLEKLYAPQAVNKKIDYQVNISKNARLVPFSKTKLMQIAGNLISNAIKFTGEGGAVLVSLNLVETENQPNSLIIEVTDTGKGMDQCILNTLQQGNGTSTNGTKGETGYGFGLSLVKHLVESLNGHIAIQSAPSKGTTFSIAIPRK